MKLSDVIRTSLEWSLCLLLIPAGLFSVGSLVTGVTFGFNLWRSDRQVAIAVWVGTLVLPVAIAWALSKSLKAQSLAVTAQLTLAVWAFIAFLAWDLYVSHWGW